MVISNRRFHIYLVFFSLTIVCLILIVSLRHKYTKHTLKSFLIENGNKLQSQIHLSERTTVFCLIKSYLSNFRINKTQTIYNVWGRKCDDYRFIMLIPEFLRPLEWKLGEEYEINEPFKILQPKSLYHEVHSNITHRIYNSIISVYKRFPDYPWYYLVDDDSYVNVDNLREFLSHKNPSEAVTYGFEFKVIVNGGYHSGGPGYVMSHEAFSRLGQKLITNYTYCKSNRADDVNVNECLRSLGARMGRSVDEQDRQRFLVISLMQHFLGHFPNWLKGFTLHPLKKGLDCCSDLLIAVHYMSPRDVVRLHIVMETQNKIRAFYRNFIGLEKNITFKEIIYNYVLLNDFETKKKKFKEILNYTEPN